MDNCSNSRANTCLKSRLCVGEEMYLLDKKSMRLARVGSLVTHNNYSNRMASRRRSFVQISDLSAFDCSVVDYNGVNG